VTFSTTHETLGTWTPLGTEVEEVGTDRFRIRLGSDLVLFAPDDPVEFKYEIAPQLGDRSPKRSRRMAKKLRALVDSIEAPAQALEPAREPPSGLVPEPDLNGKGSGLQKPEPLESNLVPEEPPQAVVPLPEKVTKSKAASSRPAVEPQPTPAPLPKAKQETPSRQAVKPKAAVTTKPEQKVAPSPMVPEPKPVPRVDPKPVPRAEPEPMSKPAPKPIGARTVIQPRAAQERSAVQAVAVPTSSEPEARSIPVRSPSQGQDLVADLKRRLGRRDPSAPHRHSFATSGVPGGLVRFVCAGCGHVSIDLTSDSATAERTGSLFRKGVRL